MEESEYKERLEIAKAILENVNIPGKKDSMLAAAKGEHVDRVGTLLNNILVDTRLSQTEINDAVNRFKEQYKNTFLKFVPEKKE